jgi:hypothetical protein
MVGRMIRHVLPMILILALVPFPAHSDLRDQSAPPGEVSWQLPGHVSIYNLQLGAATFKDNQWSFLGPGRRFSTAKFKDKLTLMVRFSYVGSKAEVPLKFIVKTPDSRQHEEICNLTDTKGDFSYQFTIHNPEDFLGRGSIYLYYGFNIVDVLDFTITPASSAAN